MTFIAHWYDQEGTIQDPIPIDAPNKEAAEPIAYMHYQGNPPKPMLWLEEVETK